MKNNNYIAFFEHDMDANVYGVIVPDFPGFMSVGDTYADALQNAVEGLASHIETMTDYGEKIPEPRTFEQIRENWDGWNDWVRDVPNFITAIIPAVPSLGRKKIMVTMDSGLVARIDSVAKNRSAFLASAAEYMLNHTKPVAKAA